MNRQTWRVGFAGVLGGAGVIAGFLQGGCTRDDPAFRVSDLAAAPGLVGTWTGTGSSGERIDVKVTESNQPTQNDRVMARLTNGQAQDGATGSAKVYVFHMVSTPSGAAKGQSDAQGAAAQADKAEPTVIDARVYALTGAPADQGGDGTLIGCLQFEPADGFPLKAEDVEPFALRFRAHLLLGLRQNGDTLSIRVPAAPVMLAPTVKLLDPPNLPSPDAPAPAMEAAFTPGDKGSTTGEWLLTNEPDRAIGVYRRYMTRPSFWAEHGIELTRVK
ncbi:MAG: hypothetical protein QM783_13375 [Phycisphaerales bacterium]